MHPAVNSSGTDFPATPAFIASLIECAAVSFEVDLAASRDYLFRALALLRAEVGRPRDPRPGQARGRLATWQTKRVTAYIENNLTAALPAKDLANLVNLSVSHFSRAFKVSVGMPPREYITQRRLDLASEMMRTTDEPLSQIALGCGLNDQSSFCRVFRRVVGQSPGEWRHTNATGPGRAHGKRK
jgi:AraC-like DNA-binding protein